MVRSPRGKTLGDMIREARVGKAMTLRDLASKLGKTASYLSDIENDRRIPSEEMLRDLSRLLSLDFNDLMARAGRLGEEALRYMSRTPAAGVLFRKLSEDDATEEVIDELTRVADKLSKRKREE